MARMLAACLGVSLAGATSLAATGVAAAQPCPDVALVLAVDGSGSIDDGEYRFQQRAIAEALRHPEVLAAIEAAGLVAVSAVFWGGNAAAIQRVDWVVIGSPADAERFAATIESLPRKVRGGTLIGEGLWAALEMLAEPVACAPRQLVNVSGDGRESATPVRRSGVSLVEARRRAESEGVTVNGLAISNEEPRLKAYYRDYLIVGPDSFVMSVEDFASFREAIRIKLIREIEPPGVAWVEPNRLASDRQRG
jgi:hypothetical protein